MLEQVVLVQLSNPIQLTTIVGGSCPNDYRRVKTLPGAETRTHDLQSRVILAFSAGGFIPSRFSLVAEARESSRTTAGEESSSSTALMKSKTLPRECSVRPGACACVLYFFNPPSTTIYPHLKEKGCCRWLPFVLDNCEKLLYLTWCHSLLRPWWMGIKSHLFAFFETCIPRYHYKGYTTLVFFKLDSQTSLVKAT